MAECVCHYRDPEFCPVHKGQRIDETLADQLDREARELAETAQRWASQDPAANEPITVAILAVERRLAWLGETLRTR